MSEPSCEKCLDKGRCCRMLHLTHGGNFQFAHCGTREEAAEELVRISHEPLPFKPLGRRKDGTWFWYCPHLGQDGLCGIYDDRPETCRTYEIGSTYICFYWKGDDK